MPKELLTKWVEALCSERYNQACHFLQAKRPDGEVGYCCLGVLQMVADGKVEYNSPIGISEPCSLPTLGWYRDHGIELPEASQQWNDGVGYSLSVHALTSEVDEGVRGASAEDKFPRKYELSELNDTYNLDFGALADLIEREAETY